MPYLSEDGAKGPQKSQTGRITGFGKPEWKVSIPPLPPRNTEKYRNRALDEIMPGLACTFKRQRLIH